MIDEKLRKELDEKSTEEIFLELIKTSMEDKVKARTMIKILTQREVLFTHQLICMMIKEQINIGYKKEYSLSELVEKVQLGKSQLSVKLRKAVEEGVIIHEKRKYSLNFEHIGVKRLWKFHTEPNDYKKKLEEANKVRELIKTKERLEKKIALLKKMRAIKAKYRPMDKKDLEEFSKKVADLLQTNDEFDRKEALVKLFKQNKEILLGYKKIENN